jgi:hypothetical protein
MIKDLTSYVVCDVYNEHGLVQRLYTLNQFLDASQGLTLRDFHYYSKQGYFYISFEEPKGFDVETGGYSARVWARELYIVRRRLKNPDSVSKAPLKHRG